MFSPVKAITAGAVVFALGGVMLIAQPFEQAGQRSGCGDEAIAPTWSPAPSSAPSLQQRGHFQGDGVILVRHLECSPQTWTSSDPRLTGEVSTRWNEDPYLTDGRRPHHGRHGPPLSAKRRRRLGVLGRRPRQGPP